MTHSLSVADFTRSGWRYHPMGRQSFLVPRVQEFGKPWPASLADYSPDVAENAPLHCARKAKRRRSTLTCRVQQLRWQKRCEPCLTFCGQSQAVTKITKTRMPYDEWACSKSHKYAHLRSAHIGMTEHRRSSEL